MPTRAESWSPVASMTSNFKSVDRLSEQTGLVDSWFKIHRKISSPPSHDRSEVFDLKIIMIAISFRYGGWKTIISFIVTRTPSMVGLRVRPQPQYTLRRIAWKRLYFRLYCMCCSRIYYYTFLGIQSRSLLLFAEIAGFLLDVEVKPTIKIVQCKGWTDELRNKVRSKKRRRRSTTIFGSKNEIDRWRIIDKFDETSFQPNDSFFLLALGSS